MALRNSSTPVEVLTAFNTNLQIDLACVKDIATIHEVEGVPTLKILEQAYGAKYASRVWIKTQLTIVNDFSGTKEKLNDMQIDSLCDQILVEYAGLNLLEFCCFCSRLRSGKYAQFFGSVDPMRILSSLEEFVNDWSADINRAVLEREKIERQREDEEMRKNAVPFEVWLAKHPPEEQEEIRARFGMLKKTQESDGMIKRNIKSTAKAIGDILSP